MRRVFLLYMPVGNLEAMTHYRDTIRQRVALERIARFTSRETTTRLKQFFGKRPIAVWGSRDTPVNRSKFEKMAEGDDLLIVEGELIRFMGKVALKTVNADLSSELWHNIQSPSRSAGWDLIYFIANPIEVSIPFEAFCRLFGYAMNYQLRGLTIVGDDRLEAFYDRYDDLYSILSRIQEGKTVVEISKLASPTPSVGDSLEMHQDSFGEVGDGATESEHAKMQWKLANLGLKAGEKVWVPRNDQGKLRDSYDFTGFESEFASGIDLPKNYYENIDVVWKEEFRIDAAFEVENSTAIYSGLLRFADLNVVAPNTTYPMFIVAPAERRNRVRQQLLRPVFRRLDLRDKVRFLSYEEVEDIDRFFAETSSGLSVELMKGRSQALV